MTNKHEFYCSWDLERQGHYDVYVSGEQSATRGMNRAEDGIAHDYVMCHIEMFHIIGGMTK